VIRFLTIVSLVMDDAKKIKMVFSDRMMRRYAGAAKHFISCYEDSPFEVRTACEVGVGPYCFLQPFLGIAEKMILIEPNADLAAHTRTYMPSEYVYEYAVTHRDDVFYYRDYGANGEGFLSMLEWAPIKDQGAKANRVIDRYKVTGRTFDFFDDGKIDVINIDCEGGEHFVLDRMISRPRLLQIEVHSTNPKHEDIKNWLAENEYVVIKQVSTHTAVYSRK